MYQKTGTYYESHPSYFSTIQSLDFTTGHARVPSPNFEKALADPLDPDTARKCFGCHTTASTTGGRFDPNRLMLGVACEACHGPGAQHVAAMTLERGGQSATFISNPATLSPSESVDFCGACHRTRLDVLEFGVPGIPGYGFPAYRLQASRCWGSDGNPRITCIACHDPH